jgi:hypothetical protein
MSEGLQSIFETVESSAELMEYYNARIEAFKLTDPEFSEVVEPLLSFEQVEFVLDSLRWTTYSEELLDNDKITNYIFNKQTGLIYPKIPIVLLKKNLGISFLSTRINELSEKKVKTNFRRFACYFPLLANNEFLCCVNPEEVFNMYERITASNSPESIENLNSDLYDIFKCGSHTSMSIPTGTKEGLESMAGFKAHSYICNGFSKNYPGSDDYLNVNCDFIGTQKIDPNTNPIDHSKTFIGEQVINPNTNYAEIQFWRTIQYTDGVHIPNFDDKSGYFEWCLLEIKKLFYNSVESNGKAFFRSCNKNSLITVAFEVPKQIGILNEIRRDL